MTKYKTVNDVISDFIGCVEKADGLIIKLFNEGYVVREIETVKPIVRKGEVYVVAGIEHTVVKVDNTTVLTSWENSGYCVSNKYHALVDTREFLKHWWSIDLFGNVFMKKGD